MMEMKSCKVFVVCMLVTYYTFFFKVSPFNIALIKNIKREYRIRHAGTVDYSVSITQVKKRFKERNDLKQKVNNHLPPPRCQRYHVSSILLLVTTYPW